MNQTLKLSLGLAGAFALSLQSLHAGQDVISKDFDVKPGGNLMMKVDRGNIHISSHEGGGVQIKVTREVPRASASTAKDVFEKHKIEMSQDGDSVTITADNPNRSIGGIFSNPFNKLRVDYSISVPSSYNLMLKTSGGNIDVTEIKGTVDVGTAGGNLVLGSIEGAVKGQTSGGNINLKESNGDAELRTSGGDLKIGSVQGNLIAKTSGGNINLDRIKGSVEAETSGGDIKVNEAYGPVMARTSGGNVSAQLFEQPKAGCELKTSGGNVNVTLAENLAVDVDAHTSGGSIQSDFPGQMNKGKTKLTAQLNGGGPGLVLRTSGGDVKVLKR